MAQGILPFKYEKEKTPSGMTALGGLPVYLDLSTVSGLTASEKAKIVDRSSQCSPRESTCSKLQYKPILISVALF